MASDLDNLKARQSQIYTELAAMTPTSTQPGGKPNGKGEGSLDHVGYKDGLYRELKEIDRLIMGLQGPVNVETIGYVG